MRGKGLGCRGEGRRTDLDVRRREVVVRHDKVNVRVPIREDVLGRGVRLPHTRENRLVREALYGGVPPLELENLPGTVLNLRTTTSRKCPAVPRRARA